LIDAVEMCGGLTSEASTSAVNMAMVLEDAMQVNVPTETEVANNSVAAQTTASSGSSSASASSSTSGLVNINTATSEELQTLSGIGESKANKIITYRQQNGSFKTIDELCNVSGIGEKTLESLRQYICV
jgi:competence protein ComEA